MHLIIMPGVRDFIILQTHIITHTHTHTHTQTSMHIQCIMYPYMYTLTTMHNLHAHSRGYITH